MLCRRNATIQKPGPEKISSEPLRYALSNIGHYVRTPRSRYSNWRERKLTMPRDATMT